MKLIICLALVFASSPLFAQQGAGQQNVQLFAQCMFTINDEVELNALMEEMRLNPNTEMVRLDMHSQRALVITQGLSSLSVEDFKSWFGAYGSSVYCVQIGVYGVDEMDAYPFTNCQN